MSQLPPEVYNLINASLSEDETFNDPTTGLLIPPEIAGVGMLRAKAVGVLAGRGRSSLPTGGPGPAF